VDLRTTATVWAFKSYYHTEFTLNEKDENSPRVSYITQKESITVRWDLDNYPASWRFENVSFGLV
jgi:hypothetical protein